MDGVTDILPLIFQAIAALLKSLPALIAWRAGQPKANTGKTDAEAYKTRAEGDALKLKAQTKSIKRLVSAGFDRERATQMVGLIALAPSSLPPTPQEQPALSRRQLEPYSFLDPARRVARRDPIPRVGE